MSPDTPRHRRQWRDYRTPAGRRPVKEFLDDLPDEDAAAIAAAMRDVLANGLGVARHLRGDIYEVRADADRVIYRILFAAEGRYSQVFLALEGFKKNPEDAARHDPARRAAARGLAKARSVIDER